MSTDVHALPTALSFEDRYRETPDPWNFAGSPYERHRYRTVMESLPRLSYARAFEPGCAVGELTAQLAEICGHVVATDVAPSAVAQARRRCQALDNVEIHCADIATEAPKGPFDLIVFSEIGYYFPCPLLLRIARSLCDHLNNEGDFVAVHWLGHSADHVLHGDAVHEALLDHLPLRWLSGQRHDGFRIDCWRRL
jgi:protein-L-isoaspartate O-methyltransferase